jgi:hypothetical protein
VELHVILDDFVDDIEEEERNEDKSPTEVTQTPEAVSKVIMDVVSKKMSTAQSDGNVELKEPREPVRVDDQVLLDDIVEFSSNSAESTD